MRITKALLISLSLGSTLSAQEPTRPPDTTRIDYRYKQNYDFVTMPETVYTFETEFILPNGYHHVDSSELNAFQNYVANFPLWHRSMPVGSFKGKRVFEKNQISRPVHLPYNGPAYTDRATPIRILTEYLHDHNREFNLTVVPNAGDTMTYSKWLTHDITFGAKRAVQFKPSTPKDTTLKEYYTFMRNCLENTSYKSLAFNCDSIDISELMPGDLFVAHDSTGRRGVTFVVMHMLKNDQNEKLYAVATGCPEACDFHIPLFNNDKNNPWLTAAQIAELAGEYSHRGFLRFRIH